MTDKRSAILACPSNMSIMLDRERDRLAGYLRSTRKMCELQLYLRQDDPAPDHKLISQLENCRDSIILD